MNLKAARERLIEELRREISDERVLRVMAKIHREAIVNRDSRTLD